MHKPLKVLVVEDSEEDFELLVRELGRQGYAPSAERVETPEAMSAALARESWEIVISDYTLPRFSAPAALVLLQKLGLDLPFIIVSGGVGEEAAVEALKAGAHDFIVKGRWARLGPAIERELREAQDRHQRKEAEKALEDQRTFLNTLIESIPIPVFFKDTAERYLGCNRAFEELIGKTRDQMIGKSFYQIGCGKLAEKHHEIDGEILSHQGSRVYEHSLQERNGGSKHLIFNKATLTDSEGKVTGSVGVISDITRQKQAEHALRESEEQLRVIVEHSYAGIFMLDEAFRCVYANAQCSRLTGYNREELVGSEFRQLVTEDCLDLVSDYYLRRQRGEAVPDYYQCTFVRKDGEKRIGELNVSVIIDAAGNKRTVGQVFDITDRRRAEEALRNSEGRFRNLLQDIQCVAVQGYGPDGTTQYWNQASELFYGYTAQEAIGRNLLDLIIPPEMRRDVEQAIQQMAETGQPIPASELSLMRKDGSRVAVFLSHAIVQIPGRLQELFCVDIDLSERKQAEEEMACSRAELKAIFDHAPLLMCLLDADRRVLYANRAFTAFTGVTEEDLVDGCACGVFGCINAGDDPRGCGFGPECRDCRLRLAIEDTIKTGCSHHDVEYSATLAHNNIRRDVVLLGSTALVPDENRREVLLCLQDITERKRAEEELRKSKEFSENLIASMQDGFSVLDSDGVHIDVNPAFCQMTGFSREELIGVGLPHPYWPQEAREEIEMAFQKTLRGEIRDSELTFMRKNGERFPVMLSPSWVQDKQENAVSYFSTIKDITGRKLAERALRESEEKFRALVETTSTGYVIIDVMGKVVDANDEYVRMSGHTHRNEILGRSILEWTAEYDKERNARALEECIREGFVRNLNIDYLGRDGQIIPIEGNGTLVVTEAGEQIVTLCRDISERKEREKKIHAYVQELRVLGALLMRLEEIERKKLARELHDRVGQTLASIGVNLHLVQNQLPVDTLVKVRERLNEALAQAEEMMDRIRDVMSDLRPSVLDDYGLLAALRWLSTQHSCGPGIAVEVKAKESTSRSTPELETAFFRIAQEALGNVAKHAQARNATITLEQKSTGLSMSIADDGVGFDTGTKAGFECRHWGLLIMRERARAVGADFRVESEPGKGTRLIVEQGG